MTEARQARSSVARLLGQLHLPAETATGDKALTEKGRRAQRAAEKRWKGVAQLPRGKGSGNGETA